MPVLLLLIALQAKAPDAPLRGAASKCGSEIPWTLTLEAARAASKESGRPVCWWVTTLDGSKMDRVLVLENYMLAGPWMMPRVVELMRGHFVPLRLEATRAHREAFGLRPLDVVEPALVFLDADLKILHRADRLTTFHEDWFVHLLRGVLAKAGREAPAMPGRSDDAFRALAAGKADPDLFAVKGGDEARYLQGVALHLAGEDALGREEWRKCEGRWAWKAAAELARDGPFVRGFEIHENLPPDALEGLPTSTTLPRKAADPARALRFIVGMQRKHGGWVDSQYNFGGDDSLPNVWMAVTALAAHALREGGGPEDAVQRAEGYLRDETKIAADDDDEIAWAHAYRLLYFARTGDAAMQARLVTSLAALQKRSGAWQHEYDNPFVTATALEALFAAKQAGADVPAGTIERGLDALASTRGRTGLFAYGFPGRGAPAEGGAGRAPVCELALRLGGRSSPEALEASLALSFKHHDLLERVRKVDDHADEWQNGGFFFWYDQLGRARAAREAGSAASLAKQREIVLSTQEIDGCWVDSHELGRVYGTAMALLTLKVCEAR
jgi:hypothetical protein